MTDLKDELAGLRIEREPERRSRRWITWLAVLVVLLVAGWFGWQWWSAERPLEVEVATVSTRAAGTQAAVLNAAGYVTARRRATTMPAAHPGARPPAGGKIGSTSRPLAVTSHDTTEFEFHMSPVPS